MTVSFHVFTATIARSRHSGFGADLSTAISTMVTNMATLVSDGAAPTQGHVNTANTTWTSVKNALASDMVVCIDTNATGLTISQVRAQFNRIIRELEGLGVAA